MSCGIPGIHLARSMHPFERHFGHTPRHACKQPRTPRPPPTCTHCRHARSRPKNAASGGAGVLAASCSSSEALSAFRSWRPPGRARTRWRSSARRWPMAASTRSRCWPTTTASRDNRSRRCHGAASLADRVKNFDPPAHLTQNVRPCAACPDRILSQAESVHGASKLCNPCPVCLDASFGPNRHVSHHPACQCGHPFPRVFQSYFPATPGWSS